MNIRKQVFGLVRNVVVREGFDDPAALRRALTAAYSFAQRRGYRYQAWLAEIKVQAGGMRPAKPDPRQLTLFKEDNDVSKR